MFSFPRITSFAAVLAFGLACSQFTACTTDVAGGVSEETNTVAGILVDGSGRAVAGVPVCAKHFMVDSIVLSDTTDSDGKFGLNVTRQGQYGISAHTESQAYYGTVNYEGADVSVSAKMEKTGKISGDLHLRPDTSAAGIRVYIPGSTWDTETDEDGLFTLEGVPVGILPLLAKSPDPIHFLDAVYVVKVGRSSTSFRGPIPTGMFELFAKTEAESDTANVEKEPVEDDSSRAENMVVGSAEQPYVDVVVQDVENVKPSKLLFPLSPEYGLRSWWSMDHLSDAGSEAKKLGDARGWTEGILVYGVDTLENGVTEKALALYGADEFGVIENDRAILDSATAMTLEAWINVGELKSGTYRKNIMGKLGFGSKDDHDVFSLAIVNGECGAKEASLAFFIADGSVDTLSCSDAVITKFTMFDEWVYVTAVWDGNSSVLYINGNKAAEKAVSVKQIGASSEPIFFGKESMNLKLDDVRLSTTAISASDVLYRYYLKGGAL